MPEHRPAEQRASQLKAGAAVCRTAAVCARPSTACTSATRAGAGPSWAAGATHAVRPASPAVNAGSAEAAARLVPLILSTGRPDRPAQPPPGCALHGALLHGAVSLDVGSSCRGLQAEARPCAGRQVGPMSQEDEDQVHQKNAAAQVWQVRPALAPQTTLAAGAAGVAGAAMQPRVCCFGVWQLPWS